MLGVSRATLYRALDTELCSDLARRYPGDPGGAPMGNKNASKNS